MADTNDDDDSEEIESSGNAIEEGEEENQSDQEEEESVDSTKSDDDDESDDVVGEEMIHPSIEAAISRIRIPAAGNSNSNKHKLLIDGYGKRPINRRSWEHLVDFLDGGSREVVIITELKLEGIQLIEPSDGGLNVLSDFFARSDTSLTKVMLCYCNFGTAEDASQLLSAFQTNSTVVDLAVRDIVNLEGAALGNSLSGLVHNMPQLQWLDCLRLHVEGVRAFQPALQANRTLKELSLWVCQLGDEGIRHLADALVGNMTMQVLDISFNEITSNGLDDITRLLESTQLKTISMWGNDGVFNDDDATQHFVSTLQFKRSSVQELPGTGPDDFPGDEDSKIATFASINNSLKRNQQLNRVNLLLAPPPPSPPQQQQNHHGVALMMFKTWHKAITKLAMIPNNAGASAIFKLFTARPQLLEKRLKRPAATVSQQQQHDSSSHDAGNDNSNRDGTANTSSGGIAIGGPKRRRL